MTPKPTLLSPSPLPHDPRTPLRWLATSAGALLVAACASAPEGTRPATVAGKKPVTFEALYGTTPSGAGKVDFSGRPPTNLVWLDDARYLWPRTDPETKELRWLAVDAVTGASAPFVAPAKVEAALAALPGLKREQALPAALADAGRMDRARKAVVFAWKQDLWYWAFAADRAVRLTDSPDVEEENFGFSPDGKRVSFVRANDLWVVDVAPVAERRLTNDGSAKVLNGKLDWLYQEEVYGRGNFGAHWWSPDSTKVAFLRLDETGVPIYTLVDDVQEPIVVEASPYPRAGETNPLVQLGVARADASGTTWVDLSVWKDAEPLVVDVAWSPKDELHFSVQDREQTWLELCRVDATGKPSQLVRETTPAWVDNHGSPTWLADGSFLWFSERDGWKHLYRYDANGKELARVTKGAFEVRTLHGVDERNGWVYWSGTEHSAIGGDAYRVKLDGSGLERLTQREGTHVANFSPGYARFLDTWSDASTPQEVRVHAADGKEERVVDANPVPALAEHVYAKPEFLEVPTRDGFRMPAMLVKPPDFDPARKYPVFQHTYAGPHAPQVANKWGRDLMFFQLLAQKGVVVWVCDNRTASGRGAVSAWPCYQQLGVTELADIEDGLDWLVKQGFVDETRIALSGWSYGGFITSYALTHSKRFRLGIAGGSVTEWDEYDSIYTERFMKTPKHNPEGYAKTSVQKAAKNLTGTLVLAHGAIDDNVHPGNTLRLANELQKANKDFDLMLYPRARHGLTSPRAEPTLARDHAARNRATPAHPTNPLSPATLDAESPLNSVQAWAGPPARACTESGMRSIRMCSVAPLPPRRPIWQARSRST
ncbi:MAG: S9 family peptidase [Planctomycetes bacterium]|nr:S9 family peptidase [Planctomycetota bacterium]